MNPPKFFSSLPQKAKTFCKQRNLLHRRSRFFADKPDFRVSENRIDDFVRPQKAIYSPSKIVISNLRNLYSFVKIWKNSYESYLKIFNQTFNLKSRLFEVCGR